MGQWADRRWWHAIRARHWDACADLIRAHHEGIYRFLLHLTRDAHLAEDLTQDTFATAWEKIDQFDGRAALGTWLRQIAYRKAIDVHRGRKRSEALAERWDGERVESLDADPLEALVSDERSRRLLEALAALAEADRALIALHYFEALSLRQVAAVLGEPVGTVKWRTSRALERLRILFVEEFDDETEPAAIARGTPARGPGVGAAAPAPAEGPLGP